MRPALSLLVFAVAGPFAAQAQSPLTFDLGHGQKLDLVRVEAGAFEQGSPETEAGRGPDESLRRVTLTKPFLIGKFPVTRGQFAAFVQSSGYRTEAERGASGGFGWTGGKLVQRKEFTWRNPGFPQTDAHPVVIVEYKDAQAFSRWLSTRTGRTFGLPSEAQWEYACRAGTASTTEGWSMANSPTGTQPVGQLPANAWGLHDLLGNTWEWCEDWYAPYPAGDARDPVQGNPNLSDKPRRVLRGGAFSRPASELRAAKRYRNDPGSRNADNGFRVVSLDVRPITAPAAVPPRAPQPPPRAPGILQPDAAQPESMPLERSMPAAPSVERLPHTAVTEGFTRSSGVGKYLFLALLALVGFFLVRKLLRGSTGAPGGSGGAGGGPAPQPGAPLRVRTVADGFWVTGQIPSGTPLRARWMAQGAQQERRFGYEPGPDGQFVFTGTQPISVSVVVETSGGSGLDYATDLGSRISDLVPAPILPRPSPPPANPPGDSGFRGHPPAY